MPTRELNKELKHLNAAEVAAEKRELQIVEFTNIDHEQFTHGFRGVTISVKAGESYICRLPEADHLAKHLARKILSRKKKEEGADKDHRGTHLYEDVDVDGLKEKIIRHIDKQEAPGATSEEERRAKDQAGLQKKYSKVPKPDEAKDDKGEVTKADVIESLKQRGVTADVKKSKDELLRQLLELESKPS